MSIDIISQVCVYNLYPLFAEWIKKYRSKFNKVILYPSRHHGAVDFENQLKQDIPETWVTNHTIDWSTPGIDWRQAETEPCLALSDAEWILFMEQDFFVDDWDKLWNDVERAMKITQMVGWWNETAFPYVHPCFLLIKRSLLKETRKDFRAHPEIPGCDHFAMITHDVKKEYSFIAKLQDMGWTNWENAFHMGGLTYPYQNWKGDGTDIFGVANLEAFAAYNHMSKNLTQDPQYIKLSSEIEEVLKTKLSDLNLEENRWTKFFKI